LQRIGLSGPLSRDLLALITEIEEPRQAWRMLLAHLARMIACRKSSRWKRAG
jgi:flagellar biosynthesis protein FlhF